MFGKNIYCIFLLLFTVNAYCIDSGQDNVRQFIDEMVTNDNFNKNELERIFSRVTYSESVLKAISRPAEKKLTWHSYRKIFFDGKRTGQGVAFWKEHEETLERAYQEYGIPPEIIVAIIGVETRYGRITGNYKVMNSLSTLAFQYPRRAAFFRKQLREFLLLAREQGIDAMSSTGSYAGAMGIPQFIPSSYRNFAVDFDADGRIDIWSNPVDAIGSVANYFKLHNWKQNGPVASRVNLSGQGFHDALNDNLKPGLERQELDDYGIDADIPQNYQGQFKLLELEQSSENEYWLGYHNFYVITRYNHSQLYAMAVYQLAQAIRSEYENQTKI